MSSWLMSGVASVLSLSLSCVGCFRCCSWVCVGSFILHTAMSGWCWQSGGWLVRCSSVGSWVRVVGVGFGFRFLLSAIQGSPPDSSQPGAMPVVCWMEEADMGLRKGAEGVEGEAGFHILPAGAGEYCTSHSGKHHKRDVGWVPALVLVLYSWVCGGGPGGPGPGPGAGAAESQSASARKYDCFAPIE
jgi:hypothetical protein